MIRKLGIAAAVVTMLVLTMAVATAGSPHFVGDCTKVQDGNTLWVTCKEAGLGNEEQIEVTITATALCINNGGHHPRAVNKEDLAAAFSEPVQNGKADYTEALTASFEPPCDPPMDVEFTNVTVTDTTNGISVDP